MAGNMLNAVLVFGGDASKAITAVNSLNKRLSSLNNSLKSVNRESTTVQKTGTSAFQSIIPVVRAVYAGTRQLVDGFRLMTQGIMSAGRALTFFVAIPLALFFKAGLTAAIDFEDQIIRVGKTTGLWGEELEVIEQGLRDIAKYAPTTHEELGQMAEQAGQLGIGKQTLVTFVQWMEILATSTNIAGDEVVGVMGKIASAFKWNINESVDDVIRLANVMNMLENTTAATAGEIADALFRFAPIAQQLNIAAADAAALTAILISAGVSAESTGTRLGTMYVKLTQNAEKFAELAANTKMYATEQDVLNAINRDAVQVLFDLIQMLGEEDNRAQALAAAFDLVNIRGGRALGNLIGSEEQLRDVLKRARQEWGSSISLIQEYNRALESAKSHLQILRNNLAEVGVELGNTLLPALNEVIELIIPLLRRFTDFIKVVAKTNKGVILLAAGIGVLSVLAGPLLFMFSQIAFGVTMTALGILKLVASIGSAITSIGYIIAWLIKLRFAALAVIGGFLGLGVLVLKVLQELGVDIASFFRTLARSAKTWGENLSKEIGAGIVAGAVTFIASAIEWVANLIAGFLEAKSPPKMGPLSHINKWGKALIDTYLLGMKKADFGILSSVGSIIGNIFKNFAAFGLIGEEDQFRYLLQAREDLAELLAHWRKTGEISQKILDEITAHLGEAADEVQELIRLNLELLEIEEELKRIEERREQVQEDFRNRAIEIATGPGSAEERVEQMRQAMRQRDQELRQLNQEEKDLEDQKEEAQEQLDTHEAMIKAMQKQDDILAQLLKTIEKLSKAAEGGYELPAIDPKDMGLPSIDEILSEIGKPIIEMEARIKSKGKVVDAFLAALSGKLTLEDVLGKGGRGFGDLIRPEDMGLFLEAIGYGERIHDKWEEITETFERFRNVVSGLTLSNLGKQVSSAISPEIMNKLNSFGNWWNVTWPKIQQAIITGWQFIKALWISEWEALKPSFDELTGAIFELAGTFDINWEDIKKVLGGFGRALIFLLTLSIGVFVGIVGGVIRFVTTVIKSFTQFRQSSGNIFQKIFLIIRAIVGGILSFIYGFVETMVDFFIGMYNRITGNTIMKMSELRIKIGEKIEEIKKDLKAWAENLVADFIVWAANWIAGLVEGINQAKESFWAAIQDLIDGAVAKIQPLIDILNDALDLLERISGGRIKIPDIELPGGDNASSQVGHIISQPQMRWVGEVPEAIIPLSKLPHLVAMAANRMGVSGGAINVNFNNPVVRDEQDFRELVREVKRALDSDAVSRVRYRGSLEY